MSGYADSAEHAIISGGCNWCCVFGPVLRAGLAGEPQAEVAHFEIAVDGQDVRVFVDGLDRAFSTVGRDATDRIPAARSRFAPDSWLTRVVLASGRLPLLATNRPTLLSTFISDTAAARTVEVKIDGCDWLGMTATFDDAAPEAEGGGVLMRELAVVVPVSAAPPLTRAPIERTLRGIAERYRAAVGQATVWPGSAHHGYALAQPLPVQELVALEARVGQLPADYRDYLATVSGFGAGPGYGILAPRGELQMSYARGELDWNDGEEPIGPPAGVLCLAHAGCGVMWLLVVRGRHRGEVWADASSSDRKVHRCAASFNEWYRDWLSAAVRDARPWIQWDELRCATASTISKLLSAVENEGIARDAIPGEVTKRLGRGSISLASIGSRYFTHAAALDPCEGCVALVSRFSPRTDLFQPGSKLALDGGTADGDAPRPAVVSRGWWSRLRGR